MSESMIERVARGIVLSRGAPTIASEAHWPKMVAHHYEMCAKYPDYEAGRSLITDAFRDARAAIAAMREPTNTMLNEGGATLFLAGGETPTGAARQMWSSMIDAALAEPGADHG